MSRSLTWYARRLRRMSPAEVAGRTVDEVRRRAWARRQVHPGEGLHAPAGLADPRVFDSPLPAGARDRVPADVAAAVVAAADALLAGEWDVLGTPRPDVADPDWFLDPVTGRRAPAERLAFQVDHRDESSTGNVKSVWELSRHHHLTVLAAAWWLTHDERYAETVDRQLRSWWAANPFLSGVHWTSGIELGVRLLSWTWIRRLLDEWPKAPDLFEGNQAALAQLWWHQHYLAGFPSRGSSANNHAVLEEAGRAVAACAFPWFAESGRWRTDAVRRFEAVLRANTFDSGLNRELATDYHRFVTETGILVAAETAAAGVPLSDPTWRLLTASLDAAAAVVDETGRPPRQGDGDEGRALVVDDPARDPWSLLLSLGAEVTGGLPWWPATRPSLVATVVGALLGERASVPGRPDRRPSVFADAGMTILRSPAAPETWCRCDGGPHGFLSIAAHAHADALSVEVRHEGVDVLADPGTYCYHGEPRWRSYFRSTRAHNTIEVDGRNQSEEGGPFLWSSHASTTVDRVVAGDAPVQTWRARHDGYAGGASPVAHTREVCLDTAADRLSIVDTLTGRGRHTVTACFHLGPDVDVDLEDGLAVLSWSGPGGPTGGVLRLPPELRWSAHRGEVHPVLGWYSPGFGSRVASTTLTGEGAFEGGLDLITVLELGHAAPSTPERGVAS